MSRRVYANPPIDEATCHFALANELSWDKTTPSHLFDHLKQFYPGMPEQQQLVQANLAVAVQGAASPNLSLANSQRIVFLDDQGINRLSVSPASISVHRAKPYGGFKHELLDRLRRDLPEVLHVFDHEESFKAVSVRYINRIAVPKPTIELTEYFNYWGAKNGLPGPFNGAVAGFFYRTSAQHSDQPENLTVTFGTLDAPEKTVAFLLDMDLVHTFDEPVKVEQAVEQLISIQALVNSTFEAFITDKCRELFE
jgi:uncharacterized protein (TIGR04255 family)